MEPVKDKRWQVKEADAEQVKHMEQICSVSPLLARIMVQRGLIDAESAKLFLEPNLSTLHDPALLSGIEVGAERIARAIEGFEPICIYGDYDVDGVTSVSLLTDAFGQMGANVTFHVPHRLNDGYGISERGLRKIAADGAKVIVSVDCGITSIQEAKLAKELGVDLVITDHHEPGAELPPAYAVINPLIEGSDYPFKKLAGVGVAFNLLMQVRRMLRQRGYFKDRTDVNLTRSLDFVTLGTIADIVPLVGINRTMVQYGLRELTASRRPGVAALKKVSGIEGAVTCGQVGFHLGPRINAAGRLDDATLGVQLLLESDHSGAELKAALLNESNLERQRVEQEILEEARTMIEADPDMPGRCTIVLASENWHPGVIGIVASRLVELYHRPTFLIALKDGMGKSSGRSIPTVDLYAAAKTCRDLLAKFGGHTQAAGLSIVEENIPEFVRRFDEAVRAATTDEDFVPVIKVEAELSLPEVSLQTVTDLELLEPYGFGNPEPVFAFRDLKVLDKRILKEKHVKFKLASGGRTIEAIGFNMAHRFDEADGALDVVGSLQTNEWRDTVSLQLRLKDFKVA